MARGAGAPGTATGRGMIESDFGFRGSSAAY
jgi:hypothetical protein